MQSQRPQDVVHPVIRTDEKRDTGVSRFMKCGILKDVFWNGTHKENISGDNNIVYVRREVKKN